MFAKLFLIFLCIPLIEIMLFLEIGSRVGTWMTLTIIIATALLGASLAQREGLKTWWRIQDKLASGAIPGEELLDALMILVAGALLLTPGFLTDAIGFCLLHPGMRRRVKQWARNKFNRDLQVEYREL